MGACASSAEPFDYPAYFARIKENLCILNMPILIIESQKVQTRAKKKINRGCSGVHADGELPEAVIAEFKFVPIADGSSIAWADLADCPSTALLLTALIDKHGWTLHSTNASGQSGRTPAVHQYVLQKPAAAP